MRLTLDNKLVIIFVAGLFVLITGGYLGWFGFPVVVHDKIKRFKRLDDPNIFKFWKTPPVPLEFKVYLYNVSNPDDILKGAIPIITEVGPYVYDVNITKELMNYSDPNYFKYMKMSSYSFNQDKSKGLKDTDRITIINVPLMGIALYLERLLPYGLDLLESAIPHLFPTKNPLFVTDVVANVLFDGVKQKCTSETELFCSALKAKRIKTIRFEQGTKLFSVAFFRHKNESSGPFIVNKGIEDIKKVGQIVSFENKASMSTWLINSTCNAINGTDSTIFRPFIPTDQPLYMFEPDMCYSAKAFYSGEQDYLGIAASKFIGAKSNFAEVDSRCRCPMEDYMDPSTQLECLKPGLIDLTPCQGAPAIVSQPHFYQSHDALLFSETLRPKADKHSSYLLVDRLTGTPLMGKKRYQLNVQMKPIEDISLLANVTDVIFPIVWVEESVELDRDLLKPLIELYTLLGIMDVAKWVLLGIGVAIIAVGFIYYAYQRNYINALRSIESGGDERMQPVLFNKVNREDSTNDLGLDNPAFLGAKTPDPFIREQLKDNINIDDLGNVMTLRSSLYPESLNARNLQKNSSYTFPLINQ